MSEMGHSQPNETIDFESALYLNSGRIAAPH